MLSKVASLQGYFKLSSRWRWTIVALVFLGVALYEFIEHTLILRQRFPNEAALRDMFFYGVAFAFLANYILKRLQRLSLAYDQSRLTYEHLRMFKEQLSEVQDDQEASAIYLQALHANLAISGAQLLLHNPSDASFHHATSWSHNGAALPPPTPQVEENCSLNKVGYKNDGFALTQCICRGGMRDEGWPHRYCYQLIEGDELVGVLYLYHTEALKLDAEQETLLHGMTSEFITMLARHHLQESLGQQRALQLSVQQRIAKHTHATLGNNLAYLRMKLDQISAAYRVDGDSILNDLIQLRDTANVSYKQMRDLLIVLMPERTANLRSILTEYAQRAADRAGFNLEVQYSGADRPLLPERVQRVFLILREAVENIEKHAQARNVQISFNWQDDGLRIHILDDGHGFDTNQPPNDKQLGLRFIRERVNEVNGEFGLTSTINSGTKLSLYIPY